MRAIILFTVCLIIAFLLIGEVVTFKEFLKYYYDKLSQ